jgi:hypothetical protein
MANEFRLGKFQGGLFRIWLCFPNLSDLRITTSSCGVQAWNNRKFLRNEQTIELEFFPKG